MNRLYVLTAAHCACNERAKCSRKKGKGLEVDYDPAKMLSVDLGIHHKGQDDDDRKRKVVRVAVHPGYSGLASDLALIRLEKEIVFGRDVSPICLPPQVW